MRTGARELSPLLLLMFSWTPVSTTQERFADLLFGPNTTGEQARACCALLAGEIRGRGITVRQLIEAAYRRHAFDRREVIGGPSWIDDERFDFTAQVAGSHAYDQSGFPAPTFATLRAYVEGHARVRQERRERPVYEMVQGTGSGPGLVKSTADCGAQMRAMEKKEPITGRPCGASPYPGRLMAAGVTMADLASLIAPWVDRPVVDRTNLTGTFDVDLEGVEIRPAGPFGPSYRPSATKTSLIDHIQPQLGLRLERVVAPVEVVVVEQVDRPRN